MKIKKEINVICIITFIIFIVFNLWVNLKLFYHDSQLYWNLSNSFVSNGKFSFENFPAEATFRGYLYSYILHLFTKFDNLLNIPLIGLKIYNSLIGAMAVYSIFLLMKNNNNTMSKNRMIIGSIFSSILLLYFFKDLILYPLTDISAMAMFFYAVYLIKENIDSTKSENNKAYYMRLFISGILIYSAYNIRTIYMFPTILLIIYFFFTIKRYKQINKFDFFKTIMVNIIIITIGASIVAFPQSIINKKHNDTYSPKVMTEVLGDGEQNLFLMQLNWGITFSKYETYVGLDEQYSWPGVKFRDSTGEKIIELEGGYPESISEWFKLVLKYPLDFMGIYTRHLITYITPTYSETYITDLNINKSGIILINMIIFIIAGFSAFVNLKTREKDKNCDKKKSLYDNIWIWITLLPCLFIIPGAPEVRFFIPLHIMIYVYVCFFVDFKKCLATFKNNPIFYSFIFLIIIMVWTAVISGILAHPADANYIFTIK